MISKQTITKLAVGSVSAVAVVLGLSATNGSNETPISIPADVAQKDQTVNFACANSSDIFVQEESDVLASEYQKTQPADCLFVSCGGVL